MEETIMLLQRSERVLETIPVGSLGLIPLDSCKELGQKVNDYLVEWRHDSQLEHSPTSCSTVMREILIFWKQECPVLVPVKRKVSSKIPSAEMTCTSW